MITASAAFDTENAKLTKEMRFLLTITGYSRVLTLGDTQTAGQHPWVSEIGPLRLAVQDLRGGSSMGDLEVEALDKDGSITSDLAGITLEGRAATLKHGFAGMNQADYLTMLTGKVDRVENAGDNTAYRFVVKDNGRLLRKAIYTTGDKGGPTSGDDPKTKKGNPLDILIDILDNEVGMPKDATAITDIRDQLFAGLQFDFSLKTAPEAKQFIERELLMPLGCWGFVDELGQYTIRCYWPLPGTVSSSFTFTDQNLYVIPAPQQSELVNAVTHRYDHDGSQFKSENLEKDSGSVTKYGIEGRQIIDAKGMKSNFQAIPFARFAAQGLFAHYADKQLRFEARALWDAVKLEPGDFVKVTHDKVPDRVAGSIGVTDKLYRVIGRTWDFRQGRVGLELLDAGKIETLAATVRRIAPDTILAYTSEDAADQARYMFVSDDVTGQYSNGDPGHTLV